MNRFNWKKMETTKEKVTLKSIEYELINYRIEIDKVISELNTLQLRLEKIHRTTWNILKEIDYQKYHKE
jgi:hypothetical protein